MAHVDNLRRRFPSVRVGAYLNTGSFGAIPDVCTDAMQRTLTWEFEEGRRVETYSPALDNVVNRVRESLASLLDGSPAEFALTNSVTEGLNFVLSGLPLSPGDEVIVTDIDHPSVILPAFLQKQRKGIVVKVVEARSSADAFVQAVENAMTSRTKLIVCAQIAFTTGQRLPIERLAELIHRNGGYIAVDGAQGAGADVIRLRESKIDFYALPGHKWLCGPDRVGALYVRSEVMSAFDPTILGHPSLVSPEAYHFTGGFFLGRDARRYEYIRSGLVPWTGFAESLQFLRVDVGWDYAYSRIHGLSGQLMDKLLDFQHVQILTPRDSRAGLVHFRIAGISAERFVQEAQSRSIYVRAIQSEQAIRVSTGFYNTEEDLDRLVNLVANVKSI